MMFISSRTKSSLSDAYMCLDPDDNHMSSLLRLEEIKDFFSQH